MLCFAGRLDYEEKKVDVALIHVLGVLSIFIICNIYNCKLCIIGGNLDIKLMENRSFGKV